MSEKEVDKREKTKGKGGKFMKPGRIVIMLSGRYAGAMAVAVSKPSWEGENNNKPFDNVLVVGIRKYPRKVRKDMEPSVIEKRCRVSVFIKRVNIKHVMPTRYSLDANLGNLISDDVCEHPEKKGATEEEIGKRFTALYKSGKHLQFFRKMKLDVSKI